LVERILGLCTRESMEQPVSDAGKFIEEGCVQYQQ